MTDPRLDTSARSAARTLLLVGLGLFTGLLGLMVATSLARRAAPVFEPTPVGVQLMPDTAEVLITIDARNETAWQYVDLDTGTALAPGDSAGWDLAAQRFRLRTAGGDLGRWYRYGFMTHLLEPAGGLYEVVTDQERTATVEVVSYYCPGLQAGCLTLRYRLAPRSLPEPGAWGEPRPPVTAFSAATPPDWRRDTRTPPRRPH